MLYLVSKMAFPKFGYFGSWQHSQRQSRTKYCSAAYAAL